MSGKAKSNLVCFDTETTGLVSYYESLIEISAVRFNLNGDIEEKFTSLLDPMKQIEPVITDLTGITNDDLIDAPPFWNVLGDFVDFLREDDILFAHNAYFDANFVGVWMSKIMEVLPPNRIYDTIAIAKKVFPGLRTYKLVSLIESLGLEGENAHRAEADVLATISLIRKCMKELGISQENVKPYLAKNFKKHFTFGQYAIKPIKVKSDAVKVIYSALRGKKNLKLRVNYSTEMNRGNSIFEHIYFQPLSVFQYKNEIFVEGFSDDETYFRRINIKRIDGVELVKRDHNFVKPILKKK